MILAADVMRYGFVMILGEYHSKVKVEDSTMPLWSFEIRYKDKTTWLKVQKGVKIGAQYVKQSRFIGSVDTEEELEVIMKCIGIG